MPLNGLERKREYPRVIKAFGDQCFCCGRTKKQNKNKKWLLHEVIYARPIQTINLRPICRSCNRKHDYSKDIILATQAVPVGITISIRNKIEFEKWLDGELETHNNHLERKYIIFKAAHDIGRKLYRVPISSVTIKRYIHEFVVTGSDKYSFSESTDSIYKKGHSPEERILELDQVENEKQKRLSD